LYTQIQTRSLKILNHLFVFAQDSKLVIVPAEYLDAHILAYSIFSSKKNRRWGDHNFTFNPQLTYLTAYVMQTV
jgi:hypothetical protein